MSEGALSEDMKDRFLALFAKYTSCWSFNFPLSEVFSCQYSFVAYNLAEHFNFGDGCTFPYGFPMLLFLRKGNLK